MTGEPEFENPSKPLPKRSHLALALPLGLFAILAVWALISGWLLIQRKEDPTPAAIEEPIRQTPVGEEAVVQAMEAWRAFLEAPDLESRIEQVRDPERVGPMLRDYYQTRSKPYPTMGLSSPGKMVTQEGQKMMVFLVEGYEGLTYPVAMVWTGRRFALDWESLTAYGTIDWNMMLETKPEYPQVMRVYLGTLPAELKPPASVIGPRQFVRMEHRDSPESAVLALKPELAHEVLLMVEGKRVPVTIELVWNPSIQSFELQRLLGKGWSLQK